jgi:hypothetical protein
MLQKQTLERFLEGWFDRDASDMSLSILKILPKEPLARCPSVPSASKGRGSTSPSCKAPTRGLPGSSMFRVWPLSATSFPMIYYGDILGTNYQDHFARSNIMTCRVQLNPGFGRATSPSLFTSRLCLSFSLASALFFRRPKPAIPCALDCSYAIAACHSSDGLFRGQGMHV